MLFKDFLCLVGCRSQTATRTRLAAIPPQTLTGDLRRMHIAHNLILQKFRAPRMPHQINPADLALTSQSVRLRAKTGKSLFGWFIPAHNSVQPSPAVVVMHGWGANAGFMLPMAPALFGAGYNTVFLDARCHGLSDDEAFTSLPRFAEDIETGIDWLRQRTDVDTGRLAVVGHSVGAGAALLCAAQRRDVAAVVSISSFAHPEEIMQRFLSELHIPRWLIRPYIMKYVQRTIGVTFDQIAPLRSIAGVHCPVLLVHGQQDLEVPPQDALRLQEAGRQGRVELEITAGGHDLRDKVAVLSPRILSFLEKSFSV